MPQATGKDILYQTVTCQICSFAIEGGNHELHVSSTHLQISRNKQKGSINHVTYAVNLNVWAVLKKRSSPPLKKQTHTSIFFCAIQQQWQQQQQLLLLFLLNAFIYCFTAKGVQFIFLKGHLRLSLAMPLPLVMTPHPGPCLSLLQTLLKDKNV